MLITECNFEKCLFRSVQFISTLHSRGICVSAPYRSICVSAPYNIRFSEHPPTYCLVYNADRFNALIPIF